jgi:hypothetical protein
MGSGFHELMLKGSFPIKLSGSRFAFVPCGWSGLLRFGRYYLVYAALQYTFTSFLQIQGSE